MPRGEPAVSLMDLYSDEDDMDLGLDIDGGGGASAREKRNPKSKGDVGGKKGLLSAAPKSGAKENARATGATKKAARADKEAEKDKVLAPKASKVEKKKATKTAAAAGKKGAGRGRGKASEREVLSERRSPNQSEEEQDQDQDEEEDEQDELGAAGQQVVQETQEAKPAKAGKKRGRKATAPPEEQDDDLEQPPAKATKRARTAKEKSAQPEEPVAAAPAPKKRGRAAAKEKEKVEEMEVVQEEEEEKDAIEPEPEPEPKKKARGRPKAVKRAPSPVHEVVPETQPEPDPMDVEPSIEVDEIPETQPVRARPALAATTRQLSAQPSSGRQRNGYRRAGSMSDTERGNGAGSRRRIGELSKELEKWRSKYEDLRAVGIQERESNFDRLKKTTDQREKDQNAIIASLKKQLEQQKLLAAENKTLQKEISNLKASNTRLTGEIKVLSTSLSEAQNETKSLNARLSTLRAQSAEPLKMPSSAIKQRGVMAAPNGANGIKDAEWQLKKDLFEDLTGLVVTSVKRNDGEIVYNCLQTGKNGTLHFVLSHPQSTPPGESWDEMQIEYDPQLDDATGRDATLMEILPDFLREGISFPRNQSTVFFARMVKYMNAGVQVVEQTEYSVEDSADISE